jgi:hypothetical protein
MASEQDQLWHSRSVAAALTLAAYALAIAMGRVSFMGTV